MVLQTSYTTQQKKLVAFWRGRHLRVLRLLRRRLPAQLFYILLQSFHAKPKKTENGVSSIKIGTKFLRWV